MLTSKADGMLTLMAVNSDDIALLAILHDHFRAGGSSEEIVELLEEVREDMEGGL